MTPKEWVRNEFPNIPEKNFSIINGNLDGRYNCIAWAAGDMIRWWWPALTPFALRYPNAPKEYWPSNVPRNTSRQAFIAAFATLGYQPCDFDTKLESDYEKVVIYENASGIVQHMARQLRSGKWSSKLGNAYKISHKDVTDIEGAKYGTAVQMLKRPIAKPNTTQGKKKKTGKKPKSK